MYPELSPPWRSRIAAGGFISQQDSELPFPEKMLEGKTEEVLSSCFGEGPVSGRGVWGGGNSQTSFSDYLQEKKESGTELASHFGMPHIIGFLIRFVSLTVLD